MIKEFEKRENICVSHYPIPINVEELDYMVHEMSKCAVNQIESVLYLQIPFCDTLCTFCPFNKVLTNEVKISEYLVDLKKEIDLYAETEYIRSLIFKSFALGGGTPTALTGDQLLELIYYCKRKFRFDRDVEISLEANPLNTDMNKLSQLLKAGVNRISYGIQTFNKKLLDLLEIKYSAEQATKVILDAHKIGFVNVGIDLLYNIPGQSVKDFLLDLKIAVQLTVEHITIFSFIVAPFTKISADINNGKISPIGSLDLEYEFYQQAVQYLLSKGYIQYSVYDFALPNKMCLHTNLYYGKQKDLLGIGASAFGFLNNNMYINVGGLERYHQFVNQGTPILLRAEADDYEKKCMFLTKGLSMLTISKNEYLDQFHEDINDLFGNKIGVLVERGLLYEDEEMIRITPQGKFWGNNICKYFFSEKEKVKESIQREILAKGRRN